MTVPTTEGMVYNNCIIAVSSGVVVIIGGSVPVEMRV